jgi:predicted nucleic-acid-binding protein
MIGLDTNILVRFITQDDAKQTAIVNRIFETELTEKNQGFISHVVIIELLWVLKYTYQQPKGSLILVLESLLATRQLLVERADVVYLALKKYRTGNADFSDALILTINEAAGCERTVTFDKKAVLIGMEKI